ncbi:hypothetical protein SASPL_115525 [Salvia splendens]|uniref:Photolyase/cryptochrome alpha/beta domain-containing protein n=1 Tax=Salvia splendens TaxID=180675 RepID=A0A8X8Y8I4_SALSN|nr:hypothetical protein SASPL_115525 [Salvia splendens]
MFMGRVMRPLLLCVLHFYWYWWMLYHFKSDRVSLFLLLVCPNQHATYMNESGFWIYQCLVYPSCEGKHCFQHVYGQNYDTFVVCVVLLDPISLVRDHRVKEVLTAEGVTVSSFNADLLYEPWEVLDQDGRPFNTFSGFWDRCLSMPYDPEAPLLPPKRIFPVNFYRGLKVSVLIDSRLEALEKATEDQEPRTSVIESNIDALSDGFDAPAANTPS